MTQAAEDTVLKVSSEEDALELLARVLAGEISDDSTKSIQFDGWPNLNIYLPRTPTSSSISPTMMEAFIELQKSVYRSYSLLNNDSGDLRGLSHIEKGELEFRVDVKGGSSDYSTDFAQAITTIGTSVASKMTPTDTFIAVLVIATLYAGSNCLKAWLKHKAEQRRDESHNEETKLYLGAQRDLMQHDERLLGILTDAIQSKSVLGDIEAVIDPARQSVVRAVGEERGGTIQGVNISSRLADEVSSSRRQQSVVEDIQGVYRVSKVDTTSPDGFRVTFADIGTGDEITASLQDAVISEEHREKIQKAEWNKVPIQVWFRVRRLRSRYIDALVVDVKEVDQTPRVAV